MIIHSSPCEQPRDPSAGKSAYRFCGTSLPRLLLVYVPPLAILALALLGSHVSERPISDFTRDVAAIASLPPYLGMVSSVGILLWTAAATLALATAAILARHQAPKALWRFFLGFGLLTTVLMLDDFFMFHDRLFPRFLGLPEKATVAIYGTALLYILIRFRAIYRAMPCFFLWAALLGFALSLLVDLVPETLIPYHHLFEDGCKLLGITGWLAFVAQAALHQLDSILSAKR